MSPFPQVKIETYAAPEILYFLVTHNSGRWTTSRENVCEKVIMLQRQLKVGLNVKEQRTCKKIVLVLRERNVM
jgi:hypothetical protein